MISVPDAARALALATLGALFLNVEPAIAPAIARGFGLDSSSLGSILGLESLAAIVGSALTLELVKRLGMRTVTVAVPLAYVLANVATATVSSTAALASLRALAGVSEGVMLAVAFAAISRSNATHRLFAWFGITQTLTAAVAFPIITWLFATYGWRMPFMAIAIVGVVALFTALAPLDVVAPTEPLVLRDVEPIGLLSIFAFFTAQCAIWPFLEKLSASRGVSDTLLGGSLSVGALCGFAGSALVAWLPLRYSGSRSLIIACALNIAAILALFFSASSIAFVASLAAFNFAWAVFAPLQLHGLKLRGASTATFALASAATTAGFAAGPILGGLLLHQSGETAALLVGIAGAPAALALLLASRSRPLTP